ncbi:MAG: trehalose-phosphatase [Verrucomicrobiales bacterium]
MILSVERLDYTKGVPQKLEAIRRFLERYPARREDCIFVIVAVPSRQGVDEYDELTDDVQREVGAINGQYGSVGQTPVQFLHRGFPPAELAAFYALADACLVTPLIDGMNLVAKEFIDCKRGAEGSRPGVLILSEFAGAAQEMSHAILVNPYDLDGVADSIARALEMPADAMERRAQAMQARLDRNDAGAWARHILGDLGDTEKARTYRTDEGAMPALADEIAAACAGGQDFALFLDYDGTLRGFTADPDDAVPDPELVPLLRRLCQKPAIAGRIAVVSGRPGSFLEKHLGETGATLVAEHGYLWRRSAAGKFTKVHPRVDTSWKEMILPHLRQAADLTPGSQIEEKRSAVVWHYRRADPEFGLWRAHELLSDLTEISANLPVAVHHGKKIVEVSSLLVSKGTATDLLLKEWRPNLALAAGDDQTDETMFALEPKSVKFYTVNVGGSTSTRARHRASIRGLRRFLETLDANLPS